MAPTRRQALLALNAALALVMLVVAVAPHAIAQQRPARVRGDYVLVSGRIQGSNSNAIYVVDTANQELLALRWSENNKRLEPLAYRNLGSDILLNPGR